jgi:copper(I)-binding protein
MDPARVINFRISSLILAACMLIGAVSYSEIGNANDYRIGSLRIDRPWATATPQGAKVGVGYMKIINDGPQPDRLIAITSPVSRKTAIHTSVKEGDVVKMRLLDKGLEIKPGEAVELNPEGMHVMFEGLAEPLVAGARAKATLTFEKAGSIDVEYAIEPLGTKAPAPAAHTHGHTH